MIGSRLHMYRAYFNNNLKHFINSHTDQPTTRDTSAQARAFLLRNEKDSDHTTPGAQLQPRYIFQSTFCTVSRNQKST